MIRSVTSLVEALRPNQWVKNLSIFAAVILNGQLLEPRLVNLSILAFLSFCFLSSSSYLINDYIDIENDRKHPSKRFRPLARGDVSPSLALTVSLILAVFALFISSTISSSFLLLAVAFILLQYSYSLFLKKKAILDILGISLFFIIRAYAGEIATGYHLPVWIMLTVIFLSLFIASGKRRSELFNIGAKSRKALKGYSRSLLSFYSSVFAVSTLIAYALFTFFEEPVKFDGQTRIHQWLVSNFPNAVERKWYMISLLPVIFGIMRYGQIIFEMQKGERPERVVATDIPLMFAILVWGLMMIAIIYVL